MVRTAPDYRVRTFVQAFELLVGSPAQVRVAFDVLQVTLAHVLQAELGIVAVHDCHVVSLHIIQVTRHQHGECRFAGSSLLGGEGDEQGFFLHASLSFVRYTSVCFPGRRPCVRTGVSAWRQGCRPLRTPGCLHARQPVCTIASVPVSRSACPCSRRYACVPAGRHTGSVADNAACRLVGVPVFLSAKEGAFSRICITSGLRGSIWRRCGSLWLFPAVPRLCPAP